MLQIPVNGAIMAYLRLEPMNCIIEPKDGKGGLYLGNLYAATNIDLLQKHGINCVLTMADMDISYNGVKNMIHKIIPCDDIDVQDLTPYFDTVADFIKEHLQLTNVFVHCFAGVSRSTSAICAYMIRHKNMDFSKAFGYIKKRRIVACPNSGFQRQLRAYEQLVKPYRQQEKKQFNETQKNENRNIVFPTRSFSSQGKKMDMIKVKSRQEQFKKNQGMFDQGQINNLVNAMKHAQIDREDNNNQLGILNSKSPIHQQQYLKNNRVGNVMSANPITNALMYSNRNKQQLTQQQKLKEIQKKLNLEENFEISKRPLMRNNNLLLQNEQNISQQQNQIKDLRNKKLPLLTRNQFKPPKTQTPLQQITQIKGKQIEVQQFQQKQNKII